MGVCKVEWGDMRPVAALYEYDSSFKCPACGGSAWVAESDGGSYEGWHYVDRGGWECPSCGATGDISCLYVACDVRVTIDEEGK